MRVEWIIVVGAALALCAVRQTAARSGRHEQPQVRVFSNLTYGHGAVGSPRSMEKPLRLDVYMPLAAEPEGALPAVLLLHGGGFRRGDKTGSIADLAMALARRGIVAVSADYRLESDSPPGKERDELRRTLLAAREDAGLALDWMRRNADRYRIDPQRIAVGGSSAGAITGLFLAYRKPGPSPVQAVVDLWGGLYGEESMIEAGDPPLLVVHGTNDTTVPHRLALDLKRRCLAVGVPLEFHSVSGAGHGFAAIPPDHRIGERNLATLVADFLKRKCLPPKPVSR